MNRNSPAIEIDKSERKGNIARAIDSSPATRAPVVSSRPARILVADDQRNVCEVLALLLRSAGYEVAVASDRQSAITALATTHYDVLVTDVAMRTMSAHELAHVARSNGRAIAIVATAVSDELDLALEAAKLGAVAVLQKPFALARLLLELSSAIRLRTTTLNQVSE